MIKFYGRENIGEIAERKIAFVARLKMGREIVESTSLQDQLY